MIRANLRILVAVASTAVMISIGFAAAPSPGSGPGSQQGPQAPASKSIQEFEGLGIDRQLTMFAGVVLGLGDHALFNVQVKLFVDGQLAGGATTDAAGYYEIRAPYDYYADTTVLMWYVPQDKTLMAKELVIRESKASQQSGLITKCVPRAALTPGRQFRVYLFDAANRNKDLAESNCLP